MCRPIASVYALATFFACPAAFAQTKAAPTIERSHDDEPAEVDALDALDALDDAGPTLRRSTDRLTRTAPVRLSLLAWHQEAAPFVRDRGLGLVLTLPLERVIAPSPLPPPPPPPAALPDLSPATAPSAAALPYLSPVATPSAAALPYLSPVAAPSAAALPYLSPVAAPSALVNETSPFVLPDALQVPPAQVRAITDAALHAAGLAGLLDGRLDGLSARSRSSALLPELRVRAMQSNDQALRLSYADADPSRTQTSGGSALLLEARATWRLDRLVYADDEVAVERLRGDVREQRQRLLLKVVEAIGAWQKAQLTLLDTDAAPRERAAAIAQASGAVVLLDALSAGAWSRLREPARGARRAR
ncbi:MAG: hypothetical protein MUF34_33300 [Polyangiaceae bacterium]|nr:hypothetical protein [Polyangiaceae bacterium]